MNNASVTALWSSAVQLHRRNLLSEALEVYQQILAIDPLHGQAHHLSGLALLQLDRAQEAIPMLQKAADLIPQHAEVHHNLANACYAVQDFAQAVQHHARTLEIKPDHIGAHAGMGNAFQKLGRHQQALGSYQKALQRSAEDGWLFFNSALSFEALGHLDPALSCLQRALQRLPDERMVLQNMGNVLAQLLRYDEARSCFHRSIEVHPDDADGWINLGALELSQACHAPAARAFERALELSPHHAHAHFNLGHCLLQLGEFKRGWSHYHWRWQIKGFSPLATDRPLWVPGHSCQRLLVWAEQGLGEELLWSALLADARQLAPQLLVRVDERLMGLLGRAYPDVQFISSRQSLQDVRFDAHLPMGDLGALCRPDRATFERTTPGFLQADQEQSLALRARLCPPGARLMGLSWRSINTEIGRDKSLNLKDLLPALRTPGIYWANLQYGDVGDEIRSLAHEHGVEIQSCPDIDNLRDMDGLAALIQACDAVISTSNSTVHLAGALGVPTYLLLPFGKARLWYWMHGDAGRSLWYPNVHLIPQEFMGQGWGQVVDTLVSMITQTTLGETP